MEIPVQTSADKILILEYYLESIQLDCKPNFAAIADRLHGFVASDIVSLVKLAYSKHKQGIQVPYALTKIQ